jgi:hypothetical protein
MLLLLQVHVLVKVRQLQKLFLLKVQWAQQVLVL